MKSKLCGLVAVAFAVLGFAFTTAAATEHGKAESGYTVVAEDKGPTVIAPGATR